LDKATKAQAAGAEQIRAEVERLARLRAEVG
jgi:hypothetical protein